MNRDFYLLIDLEMAKCCLECSHMFWTEQKSDRRGGWVGKGV